MAVHCENLICTDKNSCDKSYLLGLPQYWSAVVYKAEVVVKFTHRQQTLAHFQGIPAKWKFIDCASKLRDLEIAQANYTISRLRTCYAISRLRKFPDCAEHIHCCVPRNRSHHSQRRGVLFGIITMNAVYTYIQFPSLNCLFICCLFSKHTTGENRPSCVQWE